MKLNSIGRRDPVWLVAFAGLLFFTYLIWAPHANLRAGPNAADYLMLIILFGSPFLVLAAAVGAWDRWRKLTAEQNQARVRTQVALAGSIMAAGSAILLILLQPMMDLAPAIRPQRSFADVNTVQGLEVHWVWAGVLMAVAGSVCGIAGARKLRRPAILSLILLPVWFYIGIGLLS